jgi:hypothetical protein
VSYTSLWFKGTDCLFPGIEKLRKNGKTLKMPDYIPRTDSDFDKWFAKFLDYIIKNSEKIGLSKHEVTELKASHAIWEESLLQHHLAQASARKATETKERQRKSSVKAIRKYVRIMQARPATTNEQRRALGITLKPDEAMDEMSAQAAASSGGEINVLGY